MDERTLLKLSLLCSVVGLITLFWVSSTVSVETIAIDKVDGTSPYAIKVYGTVASVRSVGVGQVIEITQPSSIEVFLSDPAALERGDIVEVIGRAEQYQGNAQLIAERVRVVRGAGDDS